MSFHFVALCLHLLSATIGTGGQPNRSLAWHIIPGTIVSVAFVYVGLQFRFGDI